ncbi:hypothetical protein [Clostridium sp. Marseille-P3244]|nr:hypothetical protein [Clostridium sp. Marseille-P3244]
MNTKAVINRTNNGQPVGTDKTGTLHFLDLLRFRSETVKVCT